MNIHIENLKFKCIIGILDFERELEQDVIIDFSCKYSYKKGNFIDYSQIVTLIQNDMLSSKYYTLEEAISSLAKKIRKKFVSIKKLRLKISKPNIIESCSVGVSRVF